MEPYPFHATDSAKLNTVMKSAKQKMINGELYDTNDPELVRDRQVTREWLQKYNHLGPSEGMEERQRILKQLFPNIGVNCHIEPPVYCDYGYNMSIGDDVYMNFNCTLLDCGKIRIGSKTLIGPNVQLYAAEHPVDPTARLTSREECTQPIVIGENVWIGGQSILLPGITVGNNSVIGAGSVVTKDVPENVMAAGNPARVLRKLEPPRL